jgi:hypothetical protein
LHPLRHARCARQRALRACPGWRARTRVPLAEGRIVRLSNRFAARLRRSHPSPPPTRNRTVALGSRAPPTQRSHAHAHDALTTEMAIVFLAVIYFPRRDPTPRRAAIRAAIPSRPSAPGPRVALSYDGRARSHDVDDAAHYCDGRRWECGGGGAGRSARAGGVHRAVRAICRCTQDTRRRQCRRCSCTVAALACERQPDHVARSSP